MKLLFQLGFHVITAHQSGINCTLYSATFGSEARIGNIDSSLPTWQPCCTVKTYYLSIVGEVSHERYLVSLSIKTWIQINTQLMWRLEFLIAVNLAINSTCFCNDSWRLMMTTKKIMC